MQQPASDDPERPDSLRFLLKAGEALGASLDYESTLSELAWQAVPAIADWCAVDLLDAQGKLRRLAVAHSDPEKIAFVRELSERYPEDPDAPHGSYARLRRGTVEWVPEIPEELLTTAARDPEHLAAIRRLGLASYISVPLSVEGRRLGLLTLVYAESGRRYTAHDAKVAEELGRRAALAIMHAQSYRELGESARQLEEQALELELQTQQLQDQAAEMEAQQAELEGINDELLAANEQLRHSEEFARGIVEAIAEPMVVYDAEWRVRYENAAARQSFATAAGRDSLMGLVIWDVFPDLAGTPFERELRNCAGSRKASSFVQQRAASGRWTEVRCYPLPRGGLSAVWKDITREKRAEESMYYVSRASEILGASLDYETTLDALAKLVVPTLADWCTVSVVGLDGGIRPLVIAHQDPEKVTWARELQRRFPPDPDAPTGTAQVIRSGVPELHPEITEEMLASAIKDPEYLGLLKKVGFTSVMTVPLQARDRVLGALSLVSAESGRRYTPDDLALAVELGRRAGAAVDNARLYREAIQARQLAEDANMVKAAFLANMSHELRTPLNAIGGYAELLLTGVRGAISEEQRNDIARIQRSQRHLLALINEVLNYARVEAGRVEYDVTAVPVEAALADLEGLFTPQMSARDVRYELTPVEPSLAVLADGEKLQQILLNLLSNAVKFSGRGGRIAVAARRQGTQVAIDVADTGPGIPADKLDAIFEPFVQVRRFGEVTEGAGLGLAISRDLARGMRGELTVKSNSHGSTFTLTLPAA